MFLKPRWHVPDQNLVKCTPGVEASRLTKCCNEMNVDPKCTLMGAMFCEISFPKDLRKCCKTWTKVGPKLDEISKAVE